MIPQSSLKFSRDASLTHSFYLAQLILSSFLVLLNRYPPLTHHSLVPAQDVRALLSKHGLIACNPKDLVTLDQHPPALSLYPSPLYHSHLRPASVEQRATPACFAKLLNQGRSHPRYNCSPTSIIIPSLNLKIRACLACPMETSRLPTYSLLLKVILCFSFQVFLLLITIMQALSFPKFSSCIVCLLQYRTLIIAVVTSLNCARNGMSLIFEETAARLSNCLRPFGSA